MKNPRKIDENFELDYNEGVTIPVALSKMALSEGEVIVEEDSPDEVFEVKSIDYIKGVKYESKVSSKRRGVLDFYKQWKRGKIKPKE